MREGVLPLQMFSKIRISDIHRNAVSTLVGFPRRDIVARNDYVTMKNCMKRPLWKTLAITKPAGVGLFHASICMAWNGCLMLDRTVHGPCILYGNPYKIMQKRKVDQSHQHLEILITTLDRNILIDHQWTLWWKPLTTMVVYCDQEHRALTYPILSAPQQLSPCYAPLAL